jgi:hypothetical protein
MPKIGMPVPLSIRRADLVIWEFALNSLENFPFTMSVSFMILGLIFFQPTWSLISLGVLMVFFLVTALQSFFGMIAPSLGEDIVGALNTPVGAGTNTCYPYSGSARPFTFPSEWMTQSAFILIFIMYNSWILMKKKGNTSLFEAYQRRMSRTQISLLASGVLLATFMGLRYQMGCDTGVSIFISTALGAGLAVGYWHILDICNTQLNSDVLGITRNMAPMTDDPEQAIVCTA